MTAFFNSLTQLSASPSDVTVRQNVLTTAQNLAQAFSQSSNNLTTLQRTTNLSVQQSVTAINSLTAQIAQVNEQVSAATTAGQNPGAFIDQRQQLINQLSGYIDLPSIDAGNGSVTLTANNGSPLVAAGQSFALSTEANATNGLAGVYSNSWASHPQITGGALARQIQVRDQEIPTIQNSLDTLAYDFENAVNTQNAKGVDLNGMVGGNIFVAPTQMQGAAAGMSLATTDPSKIAASAGPPPGSAGRQHQCQCAAQLANAITGEWPDAFKLLFRAGL